MFLGGNTLDFGNAHHFNVPVSLSGSDIPAIDASAPASGWNLQLWASEDDKLSPDDVALEYQMSPMVGAQVAKGLLAGNTAMVQEYVQGIIKYRSLWNGFCCCINEQIPWKNKTFSQL